MREQLPALTRFYGIRPWEVESMTFGEIESYARYMNEQGEAAERAEHDFEVDRQRDEHRKILGLSGPPTFRHRS